MDFFDEMKVAAMNYGELEVQTLCLMFTNMKVENESSGDDGLAAVVVNQIKDHPVVAKLIAHVAELGVKRTGFICSRDYVASIEGSSTELSSVTKGMIKMRLETIGYYSFSHNAAGMNVTLIKDGDDVIVLMRSNDKATIILPVADKPTPTPQRRVAPTPRTTP